MADVAGNPRDDGKIGLPKVDAAMNKRGPMPTVTEDPKRLGLKDGEKADDGALLDRIRKRFERCIDAESENRKAAVDDLKFKAGDQWPSDVVAQRNTDKRPCLTVNKLPTLIHQVTNDQRANRPSINVSPVGDHGDPEAAKMYRGMIRAIERESRADIAYDTAFEGAVSNGFGYFRILTEFDNDNSFNQVIRIKRVRNPFTVYLDPDHQEPDGADCNFGFVTEIIAEHEFKETWPLATMTPFDLSGQGEKFKNWSTKDGVRIAEYFEVSIETRTLVELDNGHIGWEDELGDGVNKDIASGKLIVRRERDSQERKVKYYKVTALEVLERDDWLGRWIPIIPVIGNEIDIEGKVKLSGLIRDAKDSQRMYNYWTTSETEMIALAPKAPWIVEEGQIEGHEAEWKAANTKTYPYLAYKGTSVSGTMAPPPQRQPFAGVPAGIVQAKQGSAQDMMATTGIRFDPSQGGEADHRESGRMLREVRRSTDLGSSHYMDNLARSLHHAGDQLLDLIPKVYDEKRIVMIIREDDTEEKVTIDPHAAKAFQESLPGPDGKKRKTFNPSAGKYGVQITIGPSYATRRIEASESMMDFAKAMPNVATLIADLIAKNQDWEGAEEMAARLAKAVPPNLLTPDQKDIPPQIQALIQSLEQQLKAMGEERKQMVAALHDKEADRAIARDKIDKDFEAKLIGVIQKTEAEAQKHVGSKVEALGAQVSALMEALQKPAPADTGQVKEPDNAA